MAGPSPANPDDILTRQEVAAWLKVRPREVARLAVPFFDLGPKTPRYRRRDVIAWLEEQRRPRRPSG